MFCFSKIYKKRVSYQGEIPAKNPMSLLVFVSALEGLNKRAPMARVIKGKKSFTSD